MADVTPIIYKKIKKIIDLRKASYPRLLYEQIANYIEKYLSGNLCGFRKWVEYQTLLIGQV